MLFKVSLFEKFYGNGVPGHRLQNQVGTSLSLSFESFIKIYQYLLYKNVHAFKVDLFMLLL